MRYMAPEVMSSFFNHAHAPLSQQAPHSEHAAHSTGSLQYDERCDVYSFALLMWEVAHGRIVFEEKNDGIYTKIVVDEIVPGSNAEKADVKVGDVLRITTAVFNVPGVVDVTAWLNPPKASNCKAFFACDGEPWEKCMNAITSHAVPVDTPSGEVEIDEVGLVLERPGA